MGTLVNRRRYQRFMLRPMYAPISVRDLTSGAGPIDGHAYDISEGGMRFEVDERLTPGHEIAMQITLPTNGEEEIGPGRTVTAFARVVWGEEEDEHPPFRCAAVFTGFARLGDRERLVREFATGRYRLVG